MSVVRCEGCEMWLDTDECPETYREDLDMWLCEACNNDHRQRLREQRLDADVLL